MPLAQWVAIFVAGVLALGTTSVATRASDEARLSGGVEPPRAVAAPGDAG